MRHPHNTNDLHAVGEMALDPQTREALRADAIRMARLAAPRDPKCEDLAEYFLAGESKERIVALAGHIQQSVEDWFADNTEAGR